MATPTLGIPAPLPRTLVLDPPLTDEQFEQLTMDCDFAFLERAKDGAIFVNAPAGSESSDGNREITAQLSNW